jgi:hypothetical protein
VALLFDKSVTQTTATNLCFHGPDSTHLLLPLK